MSYAAAYHHSIQIYSLPHWTIYVNRLLLFIDNNIPIIIGDNII